MDTFKDFILNDRDSFFNLDEFAEIHNINGTDMVILIDNDLLETRKAKYAEGIYVGEILFHVQIKNFNVRPKFGYFMEFDNGTYVISDIGVTDDFYTITLEANET